MTISSCGKDYIKSSLPTILSNSETTIAKAAEAYSDGLLDASYINALGMKETVTNPEELAPLIRGGLVLTSYDGKYYYLTQLGLLGGGPVEELEKKINNKAPGQKSVFISYNWSQQDIARDIQAEFENRGFLVIRDESNLSHGVYLPGFMKLINHPNLDYVIVILSDSFLKSKNCMYEVNQIMKRYKYAETLLPFVMTADPTTKADIYSGIQKYLKHWEDMLTQSQAGGNHADSDVILNIQKNLQDFTNAVRTRINVKEDELKSNRYQAFFEMIAAKETDNDLSKEVIPLLNKSKTYEKIKNISEAENCFKMAISKFVEIAHLDGIDELGARIYGAYSEFLIRQNRTSEAEENLDIARNFGYQNGSSSSSQVAASEPQKRVDRTKIKDTDFSAMGKTAQETTLKQMADVVWEDLTIKNANILRDHSLQEFNFAKLISIDLSGCTQLTQKVVKQIIGAAPLLQKLNLSDISFIEEIQGEDKSMLDLNKITDLVLNRCRQLHTLRVKGSCITKVECEDTNLNTLGISGSQVMVLNLKRNKQLTDQALDVTTNQCPNVRTLSIEGCDRISEKEFKTKYPQSYKSVEGVAAYHGDYQKAKIYIEEQIRKANSELGTRNNPQAVELYNMLGGIHKLFGDFKAAHESYKICVDICNALPEKPLKAVEAYYNTIELIYEQEGSKFDDRSSFISALLIIVDHFSENKTSVKHNVIQHQNDMSVLGKYCDELFPKAKELSRQDLILKAQTHKCFGIHLLSSLRGGYYENSTWVPQALVSFENAIKVYSEVYGTENHVEITKTYTLIGKTLYQNRGVENYEKYKTAVETYVNRYGNENHISVAEIYNTLGGLVFQGNPAQAIIYFENALKIYNALEKVDSRKKQAQICNSLGCLYAPSEKSVGYFDEYLKISLGLCTDTLAQGDLYVLVANSIFRNHHHTKVKTEVFEIVTRKSQHYYEAAIRLYESKHTTGYSEQSKETGLRLARVYEHLGDLFSVYNKKCNVKFTGCNGESNPATWWGKAGSAAHGRGEFDLQRRCEDKIKDLSCRPT